MPPGIFPPNILKYDASSVPVLQLGLESKTLSEMQLYDLGQNFIRTQLATVQGPQFRCPTAARCARWSWTSIRTQRMEGKGVRAAALSAGYTRLRPVLMTAAAMILGMLPMSLGLGERGEQNAPLGRAVLGGLMLATVTTLIIVPIVYTYLRKAPPIDHAKRIGEEEREGLPDAELQLY